MTIRRPSALIKPQGVWERAIQRRFSLTWSKSAGQFMLDPSQS